MLFLRISTISLISLLVFSNCNNGETIEEIGSYDITTKDYESHYSANVEKASRLLNSEKSTLYKLMCNPDQLQQYPQQIQALMMNLKPENNYERYREMRIIEQVAKKNGFLDKPHVKAIIEATVLETIAQLYVQERMEERIKITPEQKQAKCEELRRLAPAKVGPLTLDKCLDLAGGILKEDGMIKEQGKVMDEIKEGVTIKRNTDFKRDQYLQDGIDLYQVAKKEGGCVANPGNSSPVTP